MFATYEPINSFISTQVQPTLQRWEDAVKRFQKEHSKDKHADKRRLLGMHVSQMTQDVQRLQSHLGYQRDVYVGHMDKTKWKKSDEILSMVGEWKKRSKNVMEKNKPNHTPGKQKALAALFFEMLEHLFAWEKELNGKKIDQQQQGQYGGGQYPPFSPIGVPQTTDRRQYGGEQYLPFSPTGVPQTTDRRQLQAQYQTEKDFPTWERQKLMEQIRDLQKQLEMRAMENREGRNKVAGQDSRIDELRKINAEQQEELDAHYQAHRRVVREKDEAMNRLSEIAGQKLRHNNPAITDLSTHNRPTKIAEGLKELYTNQWTDAFSELIENGIKEKEVIDILFVALVDSYKFTADLREKQLNQLTHRSQMLPYTEGKGKHEEKPVSLPDECIDLIKQLLKSSAPAFVPEVQKRFLKEKERMLKILEKKSENDHLIQFYKDCAEITWYMNVQSPPLVLTSKLVKGSPVQTELYMFYTQSGDHVDYVVWPACLLHENGPLLTKGVLQPFKRK